MTPNRVAYVVNVFPKLSETFIAGELAELRRRGVELRVLSLRQPTEPLRHDFVARARLDKITCYQPAQFASLLREFAPDLLHAHFATEPTAAARDLAKDLGVPFLFTAHGYDIRRKAPADFAERAAAARAVVTVSNANARCIAGSFGVPLDRMQQPLNRARLRPMLLLDLDWQPVEPIDERRFWPWCERHDPSPVFDLAAA